MAHKNDKKPEENKQNKGSLTPWKGSGIGKSIFDSRQPHQKSETLLMSRLKALALENQGVSRFLCHKNSSVFKDAKGFSPQLAGVEPTYFGILEQKRRKIWIRGTYIENQNGIQRGYRPEF